MKQFIPKKIRHRNLPENYEPAIYEARWYARWAMPLTRHFLLDMSLRRQKRWLERYRAEHKFQTTKDHTDSAFLRKFADTRRWFINRLRDGEL